MLLWFTYHWNNNLDQANSVLYTAKLDMIKEL